ncbi:MAG: hypothetical protein AMXMBFR25_18510 [Lysobacterales bacterium]
MVGEASSALLPALAYGPKLPVPFAAVLAVNSEDESMRAIWWCGLAVIGGLACAPDLALARGDKPVLAVTEFENQSGAGWWRGGVGWELAGMLSNELSATGAFKVLEREQIRAVLDEQNLAASGRIAAGTGAQIGKLTGAQYLVTGTVTAYEEETASTGGGISFGGVSLGGKSEKAYLAVDLRVINATTGEVDYTRTIEGTAKGGGMSVGLYRGGFGGSLASENKTPAGKAIRAALVEITDYLECAMVEQDRCLDEYDAKESRRREKTRGALDLDD